MPSGDDLPSSSNSLLSRLNPFSRKNVSAREKIALLLREELVQSSPEFTPTERNFLRNILALRELHVDDVMVPRADVDGVDESATIGEAMRDFTRFGHSRLPVYRTNLDDPIGFIHVKDIVNHLMKGAAEKSGDEGNTSVSDEEIARTIESIKIVRDALYVPPSMPVLDLFLIMQTTRVHLALIIDEYGGTDGLATIEDLVEAVVGEIVDEHDQDDGPLVRKMNATTYLVNGRIELDELREAMGEQAFEALGEAEEEVDTLSGLLVTLAGHVAVRGEIVRLGEHYEVKVIDADPRRIKMVSITKVEAKLPELELAGTQPGTSPAPDAVAADEAENDSPDEIEPPSETSGGMEAASNEDLPADKEQTADRKAS